MATATGLRLNHWALKELRLARGVSVSAAAAEVGVAQGTFSNWEAGRRNASRENVRAICAALQIEDVRSILWPATVVSIDDVNVTAGSSS